jgi:putative ATPase
MAFFDALSTVSQETKDDVPVHLQDSSRDKEGFGHGEGYLYPHAFRDHWVAQQYLPSSLQGKLFYQPSDTGYEREIGLRVTRLREAMVEAMAADDEDVFENGAPDGKSAQAPRRLWVKRTHGGDTLTQVREKIFETAALARDSLVLDLHARTGLLTFEALRRAPEGSVWALAHDEKEFETVMKMAAQYELLTRPTVLRSSLETFDADIKKAAGKTVAFDAIIGRSIIAGEADKAALIKRMLALTAKGGCVVLAETVHSQGQRLNGLVFFKNLPQDTLPRFAAMEEKLFADKNDPLVNWDPASLEQECKAAFPCAFTVQTALSAARRRFSSDMVDYWFRPHAAGGRTPLGARLEEEFGKKTAAEIKKQLHAQLDNKDVPWKTAAAFIRISAARG